MGVSVIFKIFKTLVPLCVVAMIATNMAALAADEPTEAQAGANAVQRVDVLYMTLRNQAGAASNTPYYGGQRDQLHAGVCSMEFSPIWGLQQIADKAPFYIPGQNEELKEVQQWPQDRFWREVGDFSGHNDGNAVFYIHGYNIGFEKSCRRAAIFQRSLNLHDRMILFSWPADGNFLKYTYDEADLDWSVPHLVSVLERLIAALGNDRLDVVAHSLGARGVFQALIRMGGRRPAQLLLNELVLVAPDIDADIFRYELDGLRPLVKRITLYASENDKALKLSQEIHGYPRLGQAGEYLTILDGVETIDISALNMRRISGHIYHLYHPVVIADLTRLLETGAGAGQRPGLKAAVKNGIAYWLLKSLVPEG